jgi:phosphoribosylformimino-5-aminoimidazole carboxamide ribotide isomerase
MRIIPAIDIIDGKCVRLTKGDYNTKKIYNENPLDIAKAYEDNGIGYLHLVDLDGAKLGRIVNRDILESICSKTGLKVDFGGGIKTNDDARIAFECGAVQITSGTVAATDPLSFLSWLDMYGNEKMILGADCDNKKILTNGWQKNTDLSIVEFIRFYEEHGIKYVIATDIAKDGMQSGSSIDLYEEILSGTSVKLVASGGINSIEELKTLRTMGCDGAIIGKAIYEGTITLKQLRELC